MLDDVRPVSAVTTIRGVAVTPHLLATEAAIDILRGGGNAVDAAVAANAMLGMVLPTTCGAGGDLFALVHPPGNDRPAALNASGRGGSGLDAAAVRAEGHTAMPRSSPWAITAPGCVDGWEALLDRFGTRPLAALLAPAVHRGEAGFAVSPELAAALAVIEARVRTSESAPELYPGGVPPPPGAILTRPRYATTLRRIASDGRSGFYEGPVADAIVTATRGCLRHPDLARRHADWVDPIGLEAFGGTLWTTPPNSQGYLTAAAAWLLERIATAADPADAAFHFAVLEAYRAMAWERDDLVGDPDHLPKPASSLLDPARLAHRLAAFDPARAASWPPPRPSPGGTAYLCVVDAAGMAVSLIQSNFTGIGSGISAGATGVWLHNRGAGFSLVPGHHNEAAPGKRPLHTLAPTVWSRDGRPAMLLGTRGGHQQPQYLLQQIALLHVAGLDPAEAQQAPRWHIDVPEPDEGSVVLAEARMPEQVVVGLRRRGYAVREGPPWAPGWGPVSTITIDPGGRRRAAADPRIATAHAAHE